jgi:tRNA U34 5-methylaminomethyl-2-thiouridine-forming methyltransferase MnmC
LLFHPIKNIILLKREIIITADGSKSIYLPDWDESYHSKHGAVQEAYHVFIKNGLDNILPNEISILEIGFGTGLNAFITFLEAEKRNLKINYTGVEAFPIDENEVSQMDYADILHANNYQNLFDKMHSVSWNESHFINEHFTLIKQHKRFEDIDDFEKYDLIYFDAFGFRVQPELWSADIFKSMYKALKSKGVLVTYAARTPIKKAMLEAGFLVEKLPGPPGKREMTRAIK